MRKIYTGDRRGKEILGRVIVRLTLGEEVIAARLEYWESTAPGKFCSGMLERSRLSEVCLVPRELLTLPHPQYNAPHAPSRSLLGQIQVDFLIKENKILRGFCFLHIDLSPKVIDFQYWLHIGVTREKL